MWSQEIRFASELDGPFNYVAGVYYMKQEYTLSNDQTFYLPLFSADPLSAAPIWVTSSTPSAQDSDSKALFFQGDYDLTDRLTLTVGGRYTEDHKEFINKFFSEYLEKTWYNFSPMARVDFQITDDVLIYGGYTSGFRSGVFNGRANSISSVGPADEELVDSFEVGFKSDLMDGRARFNAAAFYSEYTDMQMTFGRKAPNVDLFETVTDNAGKAVIQGVEFELTAMVTDNFSVQFMGGYLDSDIEEFFADLDQNGTIDDNSYFDMPYAPEVTATLQATYDLPVSFGTFVFHGSATYTDSYLTTNLQTDDIFYRDSVTMYNGRISFTDNSETYKVALWARNLTDEEVKLNTFNVGTTFLDAGAYGPPRTFGVDVSYSF